MQLHNFDSRISNFFLKDDDQFKFILGKELNPFINK